MKKEKKNDDAFFAFFARCWARASCRRPGKKDNARAFIELSFSLFFFLFVIVTTSVFFSRMTHARFDDDDNNN